MEALSVTNNGQSIVLKREPSEKWINHYNTDILSAWKANLGFQYIVDPYACVLYITSYMLKSERTMSELLRKVGKGYKADEVKT